MFYTPEANHTNADRYDWIKRNLEYVKKQFGWVPGSKLRHMDNKVIQPLTEHAQTLRNAIATFITPYDKVLTTPTHTSYFQETGANVIPFDISPLQLDTFAPSGKEAYWCDVFHKELLNTLLTQVRPTAIFLSNIPEWSQADEEIATLVECLDSDPTLRLIMFSEVTGNKQPRQISEFLTERGWSVYWFRAEESPYREIVFSALRNPENN